MEEKEISLRQLLCLLASALPAVALRVLPGRSARLAGSPGAWLSAAVALPAALVLCWAVTGLLRGLPPGSGLGESLRETLGAASARILTILYMVWAVLILGSGLSQCGERLADLGYGAAGRALFLLLTLLLALRMALGPLPAFARAAEVFFLLLTALLTAVTALALFRVEGSNLLPLGSGGRVLRGALPALETACAGVPAAFLAGRVAETERRGGRRKLMAWCAWAAVLMTAVGLACVGAYGWQTVARQEVPLYEAARQVGVSGAFQRLESAVAALLILSDVALPGLMLFSLEAMVGALCPALPARRLAPVWAAAGLAVCFWMGASPAAETFLGTFLLPAAALILGLGVPLLALIVKKAREKGGNGRLSCGATNGKTEDIVAKKKVQKSAKKKQKRC